VRLFVFAEISIGKCCYRVFRVVAKDEERARQILRDADWTFGVALIGWQETRSKKPGYRTQLLYSGSEQRDKGAFQALCKKYGTNEHEAHEGMRRALHAF
jgi:hypothetical protein